MIVRLTSPRGHALAAAGLTQVLVALAVLAGKPAAAPSQPPAPAKVEFERDVLPVLSENCFSCHGPRKQSGGLGLHRRAAALAGGDSGPAVVEGRANDSLLIRRVLGQVEGKRMPPPSTGKKLTAAQVAVLRAWIDQGAAWPASADTVQLASDHWAYRKPVRPEPPAVRNPGRVRNPIDAFVLARLEREGLQPSPEADRSVLLRRVSLDLTGLPPTLAELDVFLADDRPGAYERAVERLLSSVRYGERWARPWLDLARYADTNGYEKDRPRIIWPWRDWVIRALNDDMPFDQFTVEQLAGDLLPNPTLEQRIATGFHRNSMLNDEGGIDPEEFRVVAVKDRVDTTATVWLGTTLECAQCHSHKYDPFSQREYYQFLAFFNHTADSGVGNGPEIPVPTPEQQQRQEAIRTEIARQEAAVRERENALRGEQPAWEKALAKQPAPVVPREGLYLHYAFDDRTATDASGHGRDGTYQGAGKPEWQAGGLRLDGSGASLTAGDVADFEKDAAFSYGCWARPEKDDGCLVSRIDDPNAYRGFDLFYYQGRFESHFVHQWPDDGMKVKTTATFPPGAWHHVFVTYDGSGKAAGLRLFVDGKQAPVIVERDQLRGSIRTMVPLRVGRRHVMGRFTGLLDDVRVYDRRLSAEEVAALASRHPVLALLSVPADRRTPAQQQELADYHHTLDPERTRLVAALEKARRSLQEAPTTTTMVMQELQQPRDNHVMVRGDFRQKGATVRPDTPLVLPPLPADAPRNRLGLARWLVSRDNPLSARVTVNRFWTSYFGHGLVRTPEDFGTQGEKPTHPELLDWLAVEFMDHGWSMKHLHRLIVTSATYRQSSRVPPELLRRDPENHLYARGPRLRLEYETLRDVTLATAGLLDDRVGGKSVMPPQPPGVWENSFGFYDLPDFRWQEATCPDRYRRGIYTFLRRTALYPTYLLFDGVSRDVCSVKRVRTNTPLQALATLNDPAFVEAAGGLARRALTEAAGEPADRLRHLFRLCVARIPTNGELQTLLRLYRQALARFEMDPDAARALVKHVRLGADTLDGRKLAAWIVVAGVLLNLDEMVTKG